MLPYGNKYSFIYLKFILIIKVIILQKTIRLHNLLAMEQYTQETYHFDLSDDKIQAVHAF
jgi:lipid A disaccharide synthetase